MRSFIDDVMSKPKTVINYDGEKYTVENNGMIVTVTDKFGNTAKDKFSGNNYSSTDLYGLCAYLKLNRKNINFTK